MKNAEINLSITFSYSLSLYTKRQNYYVMYKIIFFVNWRRLFTVLLGHFAVSLNKKNLLKKISTKPIRMSSIYRWLFFPFELIMTFHLKEKLILKKKTFLKKRTSYNLHGNCMFKTIVQESWSLLQSEHKQKRNPYFSYPFF